MAHNCLGLQLQELWCPLLASKNTCTHVHIPTSIIHLLIFYYLKETEGSNPAVEWRSESSVCSKEIWKHPLLKLPRLWLWVCIAVLFTMHEGGSRAQAHQLAEVWDTEKEVPWYHAMQIGIKLQRLLQPWANQPTRKVSWRDTTLHGSHSWKCLEQVCIKKGVFSSSFFFFFSFLNYPTRGMWQQKSWQTNKEADKLRVHFP